MALETMQIFKHLPAGKRQPEANCKKCGCPTCMAFALKLSKGNISLDACPHVDDELKAKVNEANKIQQKTVVFGGLKVGGETVFSRHEKTFINPAPIFITLNPEDSAKLKRILNAEL